MQSITEPLREMMYAKRDLLMSYVKMDVNTHMYPKACTEGSTDMLKIPLNSVDLFEKAASHCGGDGLCGVHGSFRKLEID